MLWFSYILLALTILLNSHECWGQFGVQRRVGKKDAAEAEVGVGIDGAAAATTAHQFAGDITGDRDAATPHECQRRRNLANKLKEQNPDLTEQQAVDLAHLLKEVKKDPQTDLLLEGIKAGTGKELFGDFVNGMSQRDLVPGMAVSLDELRMLDYLFKNPKRAAEEMEKDGLIEDHMVDICRHDPPLLETEKRLLYVCLALGCGWLLTL
jgi:hypothetical protein